jgi:hypothetical protein
MTAALGLEAGRRSPLDRDELRRQMLALVLACVLVWYTFVVPAHASAGSSRGFAPEDDGGDGEVRGVGGATPARRATPQAADELDWPEYIYPD